MSPYTISIILVSLTMQPGVAELSSKNPAPRSTVPQSSGPGFGPDVLVFAPTMPRATIQAKIDHVYTGQQHSEFGSGRFALLFMPGDYNVDLPIGFYTAAIGLGASPDAVHISGNVHVDAASENNNATTTFWRSAEGFSVTPSTGTMQWAVSQAVPFRRMHVLGNMVLHQNHGWASGGWMSDTKVDGDVDSGTQQQWISRNVEWKSWNGSNWNMVFVGALQPPSGDWPDPPYTKIAKTPVIREKPFLEIDSHGHYSVRVPALVRDTAGITWAAGETAGRSVSLQDFYVANPSKDTAATINQELRKGKHLLLTPGIYNLSEPIRVTRENTIVLGLGFATLHPVHGTAALTVADINGVTVSGLLFDAGEIRSPMLLQIGVEGSHKRHVNNPISLHDVFFRVGGAAAGKTDANLVINSNDVIVDHTWIWRADHGNGIGWTVNNSDNGLVVNGNNVTIYGLFVEHHQQFQVLWNGENGRTYFYQSELPYDPPNQASWKSAPDLKGWASYKVKDTVQTHQAWGLGIYSVFTYSNVVLSRAIETPEKAKVIYHHIVTLALADKGAILRVINNTGAAAVTHPRNTSRVDEYPQAP